jgi:hypothetical protein
MLTRTIADLTFEVHAPHQYRLVTPDDPQRPGHEVWMIYNGQHWFLVYVDGKGGQKERAFRSREAILELLTRRRAAV